MLIESLAGLVAVRRRMVAFRPGDAMGEPLFGGVAFGLAAYGALAGEPQVDDFSHASAFSIETPAIRANYADTVAGYAAGSDPYQNAIGEVIWEHTVG